MFKIFTKMTHSEIPEFFMYQIWNPKNNPLSNKHCEKTGTLQQKRNTFLSATSEM